jgi:hypothetical protein
MLHYWFEETDGSNAMQLSCICFHSVGQTPPKEHILLPTAGCCAVTVDSRHVGLLQSASRTLTQAWGDSGYTAWSNARVISPTAPKPTAVAQVQLPVLAYPHSYTCVLP